MEFGQNNLKKYDVTNAKIQSVDEPIDGQYDRILVSAAASVVPDSLLAALKSDGIVVIPINNELHQIRRDARGHLRVKKYTGFKFVPLL